MWRVRFRTAQYLKGSLWFLPVIGAAVGAGLGALGVELDRSVQLPAYWQYSASTASTLLSAIVGSTAALTGFVVTVSVLVVQMATGTFSARYMRLWHRDRTLHVLLGALVGTLTFSFANLRYVEPSFVPNIGITVAGMLMVADLVLFFVFLDRSLHRLRPVAVAALVGRAGRRAFTDVVRAAEAPDAPDAMTGPLHTDEGPALVVRSDAAGAIQALDGAGLARFAKTHGCTVVLQRAVGDFVPAGAPLIELYNGQAPPDAERRLLGMVACGDERTLEQDPAFAVRILVDIAIRALSPAVNDPTTAVQVIDHLGETLRLIGSTELRPADPDSAPTARVLIPARGWEEYLALAVTEIREYGRSSVQVARRLRAMLEELHDNVAASSRAAVEEELVRLDASVAREFSESVDLDRAGEADYQGLGGARRPDPRAALEHTLP